MKLLRIPRTVYSTMHEDRYYQEIYMGGLISSTADNVSYPIWDSSQEYSALDSVYIPELHTVYTAKKDNPKGHPSVSRGWFKEGDNPHKMLDAAFSSKTIFTDECIVEFDIAGMSHILGRGIVNAKEVQLDFYDFSGNLIDTNFNCDSCTEIANIVTMTYDEDFNCFSCCNKDPILHDSFVIPIGREFCEMAYKVKITITKDNPNKPILVSTMCVADSYDFGCAQKGFKIGDSIPAKISEFPELQATGIEYANMKTHMRGELLIKASEVDRHRHVKKRHSGYLNYYLFDELDAVKSGLILGISTDTEYTFSGGDYTIMSFEAMGVEH